MNPFTARVNTYKNTIRLFNQNKEQSFFKLIELWFYLYITFETILYKHGTLKISLIYLLLLNMSYYYNININTGLLALRDLFSKTQSYYRPSYKSRNKIQASEPKLFYEPASFLYT